MFIRLSIFILSITLWVACENNKKKEENLSPKKEEYTKKDINKPNLSKTDTGVINFLNATESIIFSGTKYNLAWSTPPQMEGQYFIQEYMPEGQVINQYQDLFILDLYKNKNTSLKAEVKEKTDWLDNRKITTDPSTAYTVKYNEKKNEYMVDLIVSDGDVVEWTVIRYAPYEENGKFAGVKTFCMSKRGYEGIHKFTDKMTKQKSKLLYEFLELPFPEVKP